MNISSRPNQHRTAHRANASFAPARRRIARKILAATILSATLAAGTGSAVEALTPNPSLAGLPANTALALGQYSPPPLKGCISNPASITNYGRITYDSTNHQMLMFGGGKGSTPRTDVDVLNPNLLRWQSSYASTPVAQMTFANFDQETGGWISTNQPVARHTHDMASFSANTGELILMAPVGPQAQCEQAANYYLYPGQIWHFNPVTAKWSVSPAAPLWRNDAAPATEFDPISGRIIVLSRYGLFSYDPESRTATQHQRFSRADYAYAQNLVYYPPTDRMYLIQNDGTVFELVLDRSNLATSTITKVTGISGTLPTGAMPNKTGLDTGETGWAYDSANRIIGGGVVDGTFYAYDPATRTWSSEAITTEPAGQTVGKLAFHSIDYDPVNNVFMFISDVDLGASRKAWYTWAYRYRPKVDAPSSAGNAMTTSDAIAPSAPEGLLATTLSNSQINLTWNAASDNVGVVAYRVYRDGALLVRTPDTSLVELNLHANTIYAYAVSAVDAAGNESARSTTAVASTRATNQEVTPIGAVQPVLPENALRVSDSRYSGTTWKQLMTTAIDVPWKHPGGDWRDREGNLQGIVPWATADIFARQAEQKLNFDVTELVSRHLSTGSERIANRGWIVRMESGTALGVYYSREVAAAAKRPVLTVTTTAGTFSIVAGADAPISTKSVTAGGNAATTMPVQGISSIALWFDLTAIRGSVLNATMTLTSTKTQYARGVGTLGLYPVDLAETFAPIPATIGLGALFPGDVGLETHPDVLFVDRFPDLDMHTRGWWWDASTPVINNNRHIIEDSDPDDPNFVPLAPGVKAYKMTIPKGGYGGDFGRWHFWSNLGYEPDEIYIRTYARLGDDFDSTKGKFPFGFDGTYHRHTYLGLPNGALTRFLVNNPASGRTWLRPGAPAAAGNGGSPSNGTNGWSARGLFVTSDCDDSICLDPQSNPLTAADYRGLGFYTYWVDQPEVKGGLYGWRNGLLGLVKKNTWFVIDQYLKLNSVNPDGSGNRDGVLRAWVDGRLAFEKTDFRVRHWPGNPAGARNVKVDAVWLNFYHGGLDAARSPMTVYLSNMVVSKSFVGPSTFTQSAH